MTASIVKFTIRYNTVKFATTTKAGTSTISAEAVKVLYTFCYKCIIQSLKNCFK